MSTRHIACCLLAWAALPIATAAEDLRGPTASEALVASIPEPALAKLLGEVLERNPSVAAARARARAARQRAPQARALPDPVATLGLFVDSPETRTGPQRLSVGISQGIPWRGKLALRERMEGLAAAALEAEVEAERLSIVAEVRRLFYELAFLNRYQSITQEFHAHLLQHEEISRARYATGVGTGLGVVKLQAEITRVERELVGIESQRVGVAAELNRLRDEPALAPLPLGRFPDAAELELDAEGLRERALTARPELAAAAARIAQVEAMLELAEKSRRPDFRVGLAYTVVDPRDDEAGRLQPPDGNGNDILAIQGGITLPVRRRKREAEAEEARERRSVAREAEREVRARIEAEIGDLTQRVPLEWRQLRLVEDLLIVQAEEALGSAQSGYVAGTLNALDLLDAEHVLYEARTAAARALADYLVDIARLESAVGAPLQTTTTEGSGS